MRRFIVAAFALGTISTGAQAQAACSNPLAADACAVGQDLFLYMAPQLGTSLTGASHTLGVGTAWQWGANVSGGVWTGPNGLLQIRLFDGDSAAIHSDGTHFWPYGLNYDNEGSTEAFRRHVLMMAAFRRDMGLQ